MWPIFHFYPLALSFSIVFSLLDIFPFCFFHFHFAFAHFHFTSIPRNAAHRLVFEDVKPDGRFPGGHFGPLFRFGWVGGVGLFSRAFCKLRKGLATWAKVSAPSPTDA